ncbi:MAG: hypothetical protein PHH28_07255 [Desulfuromonadaceae bacterium]|nr:hypothetical protein [Desulfuromonadaceae bacterium]
MKKPSTKHTVPAPPVSPAPETIDVLACKMADDFNNILTTLLGACSLIDMNDPANGELLHYVALIRASAEHAAALSDRLASAFTRDQKDICTMNLQHISGSADTSVSDKKSRDGIVSSKNLAGGTPL